jgi:uncharacterized membrane protein YphA (DoxX/SURF4 family)
MKEIKNYMKMILYSPWPYRFVRSVLGAVFVYAGFIKLIDPKAFARVISQYDLIPESLLAPVAVGLPLAEFLAGLGLLLNIRGSLSAIFSMLMMFSVVLGYGIFNDLNIDCGCFTPEEISQQNSLRFAFYRDLLMIGGACFLYLSRFYSSRNAVNQSLWTKFKSIRGRS